MWAWNHWSYDYSSSVWVHLDSVSSFQKEVDLQKHHVSIHMLHYLNMFLENAQRLVMRKISYLLKVYCNIFVYQRPHCGIFIYMCIYNNIYEGFPGGSAGKKSAGNKGDLGLIPGSGRSPGEGNGNPLQYSCLENSMDKRSLAGYSPWGRKELDMTEQISLSLT